MQRRITASAVMKGATFVAAALAVAGIVAMLGADARIVGDGGISSLWWLVGIATAAIAGALAWVLMDARSDEPEPHREEACRCPSCGRGVLRPWRMCPYCGAMLDTDDATDQSAAVV